MTGKRVAGGIYSLVIGATLLTIATGCRHEETIAIGNLDSTNAESPKTGTEPTVEQAGMPVATAPAVTPIPYRSPVPVQPRAAAPEPQAAVQPVYAQYPAPVAKVSPPPRPTPVVITVPAGTVMRVRLEDFLSSHTSQVGQRFSGTVVQDIAAEGRVAVRSGSQVLGRVTEADPAKKIGGRARLSLDFETLDLGSGQTRPMSAQFAQAGKSQTAKDAAIIGGSTIGGAVIGEAIEDGEGGVIGAIVGGLGGAYGAKKTKAKPVEVPAGTIVDLELTQPITLELYPE